MDIHRILKEYWGFSHFRAMQEPIIRSILEGKDTLALLPTGGGKSVCFQVPAMLKDGICLVVSPLIALMKDQVENLNKKGIPALAVYSGMSFQEVKKTLQQAAFGDYKFLYVSPERLETDLFETVLASMKVNLIAVDEAHCISQWGYDFRPPYMRIAKIRERLPGVPVLALTASATKLVQEDICEKLHFGKTQQRFQQSFERPNLSYSVFPVASKQQKLIEILTNVSGSAIVYCKSRKSTREIAELLMMNGIAADHYHAGLSNEERNAKQTAWIQNKTRVIVCTNAFGMGIDKPDVRTVVHYHVPDCLENYYQEAGRAGRDGERAYAVMLHGPQELNELLQQTDIRYPSEALIKQVYVALMNHLQIAAGSGEGMQAELDMGVFAAAFKLNILTATYAIKVLEQESVLWYNEVFFKPSTVVFSTNKQELAEFEHVHPELEPLIKGLLRSYEGIFDHPATVYESQLAKFIRTEKEMIKKDLKKLHDRGMIVYHAQKEKPQLTLLQNRMYLDNYSLDTRNYLKRKKNYEERVEAMIQYAKNETACRSKIIAAYFNDVAVDNCGICDNCIRQKTKAVSLSEFEIISGHILKLAKTSPVSVPEIWAELPDHKKETIWEVIHYLQAEKKISADQTGKLSVS
ncbi:MAG: RecQ family ATP-dependent DNA helicase [Chitinophagaceae bacterium]|nr:MAG: RecQ family ATP-dependent DNA helicase [Chitinophagaceae bacterium]